MRDRDLGSCLAKLRVLWMSRCGLEDVQGIGSMSNLRELYVSYNDITDVTPCGMLESLEILDLEGWAFSVIFVKNVFVS
jgi:Leucine-rich repeat (LRR) protein